jgi:hypothetical protein
MRAIKQAMGIKQRYFILQDVRRFLADNPDFIRQHSPKNKSLPSYRLLLLSAVMELTNLYAPSSSSPRKCSNAPS